MPHKNSKTVALSTLFIFLGLVSRDLNAHHQPLSLKVAKPHSRPFSVLVRDVLYTEPTLTIRRVK